MLSNEESLEILEAAEAALVYARNKARQVETERDPNRAVEDSVTLALQSVRAALADRESTTAVKAFATNASAKLRSVLLLLQESDADNHDLLYRTMRASARALSLLYPFTQTEGPLVLPKVKSRARVEGRRAKRIAAGKRRPTLHITLGCDSNTNFYCGIDKDITSGGLFVSTYNLLPVGRTVNLVATLPDRRVIVGSATVAFVRDHNELHPEIPPGMGLILNRLTAAARSQINDYMDTVDPIYFEAI